SLSVRSFLARDVRIGAENEDVAGALAAPEHEPVGSRVERLDDFRVLCRKLGVNRGDRPAHAAPPAVSAFAQRSIKRAAYSSIFLIASVVIALQKSTRTGISASACLSNRSPNAFASRPVKCFSTASLTMQNGSEFAACSVIFDSSMSLNCCFVGGGSGG